MHLKLLRGVPLLALTLCLAGCDLFLEPQPTPQLVVVNSTGEVRMLSGDDALVEVAWTADVLPSGLATVRVAGDDILIASGSGLSQFSASSGISRWARIELPSDVLNLVYSGTDRLFSIGFNELAGVDLGSGGLLWSRSLLDDLLDVSDRAITASADRLAVGGVPVRLLDTESGIVLTEGSASAVTPSAVGYAGAALLVGDDDGVRALDSLSLATLWSTDAAVLVDRFVVSAGGVLVSTLGEGLFLLDPDSGAQLASAEPGEIFRDVAASGGLFFAARSDGTLLALDGNLDEVWRAEGDSEFGGLSVSSDTVYYARGAAIEALTAVAGDLLWSREFSGSVVGLAAL
jgi:hypothetical protein